MQQRPSLHTTKAVDELQIGVVNRVLSDLESAERLAASAELLAVIVDRDDARAIAQRARGHIFYSRSDYARAHQAYSAAIETFDRLNLAQDAARTRNGALQTLIYLGLYDQALAWAASAREELLRSGDLLRAARCDLNAGNVYYRQDKYEDALASYRRAEKEFEAIGTPRDTAAAFSNIAVCLTSLQDYDGALATYEQGRRYCVQHEMWLWVAESDYNVAYLHFLRGEYIRAMRLYQSARQHSEQVGDGYHKALCDLDQAEMFLELNLLEEGTQLAKLAEEGFSTLGMGYERAKALTFLALAAGRRGNASRAIRLLSQARLLFRRENNETWPAYLDLYQALVRMEERRLGSARLLARRALHFFGGTALWHKSALCELILAKVDLLVARIPEARQRCLTLLETLPTQHAATILFETHFLIAQTELALDNPLEARRHFESAIALLESVRSSLAGDDLKIAFLRDKLTVYDHYLSLLFQSGNFAAPVLFDWMERSKCRELAELMRFQAQTPRNDPTPQDQPVAALRQSLNACYRQLDEAPRSRNRDAIRKLDSTWAKVREYEGLLAARIAELQVTESQYAALHDPRPATVEQVREGLPAGATLLEYFQANDRLLLCVIDARNIRIVEVGHAGHLESLMRLLRFQLAKFQLGGDYTTHFSSRLLAGTRDHLRELYRILIDPVRSTLDAGHLVIVPHGSLHHVPFHALFDGERYLMDDFSLSYAPSSTVYTLCAAKLPSPHSRALAIGIPDAGTQFVEDEIQSVAAAVPGTLVLQGEAATLEALRVEGARSRLVHIASHGQFRQDNPMFSFVQLGDTRLSLYDLYDLSLPCDLVTLSGCSTGLSSVSAGDELLGLVRGLFYAGARGVMLSLWDVHDPTASQLMTAFYSQFSAHTNKAEALRAAMHAVRDSHPHPYYWAPFIFSGKFLY